MKKLPEIIEDCVTEISTVNEPVYFLFANWVETCNELIRKGQSDNQYRERYPLILLHNSYSENSHKYGREVDEAKIYIIGESELDYSTDQRRTLIYAEILEPIFDRFISVLNKGSKFHKDENGEIPYTKTDLYKLFVGDKQNRLPDHLDAIEISLKNLIYYLKNC